MQKTAKTVWAIETAEPEPTEAYSRGMERSLIETSRKVLREKLQGLAFQESGSLDDLYMVLYSNLV